MALSGLQELIEIMSMLSNNGNAVQYMLTDNAISITVRRHVLIYIEQHYCSEGIPYSIDNQ